MRKDTSCSLKKNTHQVEILVLNIYAPKERAATFIKDTFLKLKSGINLHTLTVGDFKVLLLPMDKSSRKKVNRNHETN